MVALQFVQPARDFRQSVPLEVQQENPGRNQKQGNRERFDQNTEIAGSRYTPGRAEYDMAAESQPQCGTLRRHRLAQPQARQPGIAAALRWSLQLDHREIEFESQRLQVVRKKLGHELVDQRPYADGPDQRHRLLRSADEFALASPVQWTESVNGWNLDLNHNAKVLLGSDGSFKYNAEKKWNKNLTFNLTAHVDLNNWKKTNLGNLGFGVTYE
eukprot:CAMPEP_0116919950 /NCGR_PEP_ID=MMETSP0467-20121206/20709_1 /TAXON_ID=283647 /ORGANISM="Mesodinium pulex, Strain SPMC105" /LENGTH=213 /DNA_ID=CAMNT_0004597663 /DNA_START=345 /DNA_END=987 /DNA_ORIENTATION=+